MGRTQINSYITFNGNCREAMTFYRDCLGGELILQKIAESPMAAQMPSEMGAKILHSSLMNEEIVLMASDMCDKNSLEGSKIKLCVECSNEEEIELFFTKLSLGGNIKTPLHQTFWGAMYGELTDKFGMDWMFNFVKG